MKGNAMRNAAVLAAMLAATACGTAGAAVGTGTLLGEAVSGEAGVDKVVRIDANTPWVNAVGNQTVKFSAGGKEFTWRFPDHRAAVNLKEIAPAGFVDRDLNVYLQPDPAYNSGS